MMKPLSLFPREIGIPIVSPERMVCAGSKVEDDHRDRECTKTHSLSLFGSGLAFSHNEKDRADSCGLLDCDRF